MSSVLEFALAAGTWGVLAAAFLSLIRLILGPSLPDRVVALDMMTVAIVAFCGLAAIRYDNAAFLDVALALALVGFLATVALARFAERARTIRDETQTDTKPEGETWTRS